MLTTNSIKDAVISILLYKMERYINYGIHVHMYADSFMSVYVYFIINYVAPSPRVFKRPNHLQQGVVGEQLEIVCSIVISFTAQTSSVNLTWNFTSNDDRITVIPTTITTDDSIGIIYTTVIQFAYLMEGDEGNYICTVSIDEDSVQSTLSLEIFSKYHLLNAH